VAARSGQLSDDPSNWEIDLVRRELRMRGAPVALGNRAFDIVEVLVQSAGELVSKDDLISRVWPGAIVEENTLQVHISAIRKALAATACSGIGRSGRKANRRSGLLGRRQDLSRSRHFRGTCRSRPPI
jgi:DNA-binding response OmpR family regulator